MARVKTMGKTYARGKPAKPKVSKRLAGQMTVKKGKGEGVGKRTGNISAQPVKKK